ncbi:hypothetical protein D3C72_1239050 [compost metagenome]
MRAACHGMGHLAQQTALAGPFAGQSLVQSRHLATGNAAGGHALEQQVARKAADQARDQRGQRLAVSGALHIGGIARVLDDVRTLDDLAAELVELAVVAHGDDQRAIGGLEHAIGHDGRMGIAIAGGVAPEQHGVQAVVAGDHQPAVVQRHLDQLALALALAAEQGSQHRLRGIHAGHQVHHGYAELQRRRVGFAVERHQAGLSLDHQVVAGTLGLGTAAVVA